MLKKSENNVGARTHPCLTPLEMGNLPDRDPFGEDGERFWGTAKAHQDIPQSITADSIKGRGQVYESCI